MGKEKRKKRYAATVAVPDFDRCYMSHHGPRVSFPLSGTRKLPATLFSLGSDGIVRLVPNKTLPALSLENYQAPWHHPALTLSGPCVPQELLAKTSNRPARSCEEGLEVSRAVAEDIRRCKGSIRRGSRHLIAGPEEPQLGLSWVWGNRASHCVA